MSQRRRPRWLLRIIGVLVTVGVLAGAGEVALRLIIPSVVQGVVRGELDLAADHPVDVSLGGSALIAALGGGVGNITVTVPDAPLFAGIKVDATVRADRVPFDPASGDLSGGTAELSVPKEQLGSLIGLATQGIAQSGETRDGNLVVGRSVEAFGQQLKVSATLGLSIVDGDVKIEPRGLQAAGFDIAAERITELTGSALDPILQTRVVCVRDRLPSGITLTGISLPSSGSATIEAKLSPGIISDSKQRELGRCG